VSFFAFGFLAAFLPRAEIPFVGIASGIAAVFAILLARPKTLFPPFERRNAAAVLILALSGAAVGAALPAAVRNPRGPRAPSLDARSETTRFSGRVARCEHDPDGAARVRLSDGLVVVVRGAASAPPPGSLISGVGRLDPEGRRVVVYAAEGVVVRPPPPLHPTALVERLRRALTDRMRSAMGDGTADVCEAVLFGRPTLPRDLRDDLARIGALHVVAVSGSHLSMVLAGLRVFTARLRFVVPTLVLYAALTGFSPPVLRSLVLAVGACLGRRAGGRQPPLGALAFSACVVLSAEPSALFDVGFQLSFAAFFGLQCATPAEPKLDPLGRRVDGVGARIVASFRASSAATLMTLPIGVAWFHQAPWLGPLATFALAPAIPLLLLLSAAAALFPAIEAPGVAAEIVVAYARAVAALFAAVPGSGLSIPRPFDFALAFAFGAAAYACLRLRNGSFGLRDAAVLLFSAALLLVPAGPRPGLYALDARRGSAFLVAGREATILVDAGPPDARVESRLLELGVSRLDAVFVSHGHMDHAGGLSAIAATTPIGAVYCHPFDDRAVRTALGRGEGGA
jgi:ComEC/Rec2-related protein